MDTNIVWYIMSTVFVLVCVISCIIGGCQQGCRCYGCPRNCCGCCDYQRMAFEGVARTNRIVNSKEPNTLENPLSIHLEQQRPQYWPNHQLQTQILAQTQTQPPSIPMTELTNAYNP